MPNHSITPNDQPAAKQPDEGIEQAVASHKELVRLLSAGHEPELPGSSLTMAQMKVLMVLSGVGESRMSDLAPHLGISLSTLSSLVERLVEADLASRRDDPRDRRNVLVSLSPAGADLLDTFQELGVRQLRNLLSHLDGDGITAINHAYGLLIAAARRMSPEERT